MCERCEERDEMTEIMNGFGKKEKSAQSCPTKNGFAPKDMEAEEFKNWYNQIAGFSKQLKECLLSSASFDEKMQNLYNELKTLDLLKDRVQIVKIAQTMLDYARMQETNAAVARQTAEILVEKIHGNH
jgi:hypothetical protein